VKKESWRGKGGVGEGHEPNITDTTIVDRFAMFALSLFVDKSVPNLISSTTIGPHCSQFASHIITVPFCFLVFSRRRRVTTNHHSTNHYLFIFHHLGFDLHCPISSLFYPKICSH